MIEFTEKNKQLAIQQIKGSLLDIVQEKTIKSIEVELLNMSEENKRVSLIIDIQFFNFQGEHDSIKDYKYNVTYSDYAKFATKEENPLETVIKDFLRRNLYLIEDMFFKRYHKNNEGKWI